MRKLGEMQLDKDETRRQGEGTVIHSLSTKPGIRIGSIFRDSMCCGECVWDVCGMCVG